MLKRWLPLIACAMALAAMPSIAAAGDADKVADELKDMKPQDLYKSLCRPCHLADSEAGDYTPMSLIQEQWEEFFAEIYVDTHEDVPSPRTEGKTVTQTIDKVILEKIREFCIDHAADSEQPMTCG